MSVSKACPFCAETIQAAARICKHCRSTLVEGPVLVEQTGKKHKAKMLIGRVISLVGIIIIGTAVAAGAELQMDFTGAVVCGLVILLIGGAVYSVAQFQAWWHHG